MNVFGSLVTRPQYARLSKTIESGTDLRTEDEFILLPDACRIAETDPSRLELAGAVMQAVLAVYTEELADEILGGKA